MGKVDYYVINTKRGGVKRLADGTSQKTAEAITVFLGGGKVTGYRKRR